MALSLARKLIWPVGSLGLWSCLDTKPVASATCLRSAGSTGRSVLMLFFGESPSIGFLLDRRLPKTEILWFFCCGHVTSCDWLVFFLVAVVVKRLSTSPANARALITASLSLYAVLGFSVSSVPPKENS